MAVPVADGDGVIGIEPVFRKHGKAIERLPIEFVQLLCGKFEKWGVNYNIPFTVGSTDDYAAIAITHPLDHFSRKIGVKIVSGRLARALGDSDRPAYETLPVTVCKVKQAV